ncbi:PDR/VanB family oxidoreductase [Acidovorax sp.]|uniref:PDR/VanB family oxidoreductase n=1 Tax=Acidovorax sp. TaxID=1872122 RepID=UPI00261BD581|nr:PDR/VanB family oxidoreductase [Acidovorax sp.]
MQAKSLLNMLVRRKTAEALDICSFDLVSTDDVSLPAFAAGAHIDVHLPNGLTRQYSLCNDPTESNRYLICVLSDPESRGGSRFMHESVSEGDKLFVSAPKNHFALAHGVKRSLLLAGGIGITPILCMAERLTIADEDFELHYSARSRARMAFHDYIQRSKFADKTAFHFSDGDAVQRLHIDTLLSVQQAGTHLYVCGPKRFMDAVLGRARAIGWPEQHLHYEFFVGLAPSHDADGPFEVKLASSGKVVHVAKHRTVVEALADAGVKVQTSCEQGVCGTCLTRVLEGEPDHRDMFLSPSEQAANDQFLPCCSRARSMQLVLDL